MLVNAIYLLTGTLWAGRSILEVVAHPRYWDPVTTVDWIAVWGFTACLLALAATILLIATDSRGGSTAAVRTTWALAAVTSFACVTAGVGNAAEDAFGVPGASAAYVFGVLTGLVGVVAVFVSLGARGLGRLALAVGLLALGMATMSLGFGFVVLIGCGIAVRERVRSGPRLRAGSG